MKYLESRASRTTVEVWLSSEQVTCHSSSTEIQAFTPLKVRSLNESVALGLRAPEGLLSPFRPPEIVRGRMISEIHRL